MNKFYKQISDKLNGLRENDRFRKLPIYGQKEGKYIEADEKKLLNLSSNDYLGLTTNRDFIHMFLQNTHWREIRFEPGGASSRLLSGNSLIYSNIENNLSALYQKEAALFFNSGYHANLGILPAITKKNDLVLSDKLNHASITDGLRLSAAKVVRYKHLDYNQIDKIISKNKDKYDNIFIVSESVFSMDGDIASIDELVRIKNKHNAIIYIDEAHAIGVFGAKGRGICEETQNIDNIDIIVGTCGKSWASTGAFAICNKVLKDYLVNNCRSLIYTTALPPFSLRWTEYVITEQKKFEKQRLIIKELHTKLRNKLREKEIKTKGNSQIVPIIVGEDKTAMELADHLRKKGFLCMPVRPPTVAKKTARLRLSLTSAMQWDDIKEIPDLIRKYL